MRFQTHTKISLYLIKKLLLISSLILTISVANAEPVTFHYEGVITEVNLDLRRTDDNALVSEQGTDNLTGYEVGDMFSGEYTFESNYPAINILNDYSYANVVSSMSFVSGNNTLGATNGSIDIRDNSDETEYFASFSPVTRDEGILYNPSLTADSLKLIWFISPETASNDLLNGPPLSPLFDTNIIRYGSASTYSYGPVYGKIDMAFSSPNSTASVKGILHSITVDTTELSISTTDEMMQRANQDNRFGSSKSSSFGEDLGWSADWELRWIDFDFSENRVVRIFHATNKQDSSLKYTIFYDPDTNAWAAWVKL